MCEDTPTLVRHCPGMPARDPHSLAEIARRLRLTRLALGYATQAALSRVSGIAENTWSNYEQGLRRISLDEANKLRSISGLHLDWIYHGVRRGLPPEFLERVVALEADEKRALRDHAPERKDAGNNRSKPT